MIKLEPPSTSAIPRRTLADGNSVNILPPISGRDVLAVGKNYSEHAKEFNASGYDASDKIDMPSHPVIFTKRATSIIANEEDILLHSGFTETLDYEGEIGVIIGKGGFKISEEDAEQHVWGYTIINDVTAREKQRDHKQFYIGKFVCSVGAVIGHDSPRTASEDAFVTDFSGGLSPSVGIMLIRTRQVGGYLLSYGTRRRSGFSSAKGAQGYNPRERREASGSYDRRPHILSSDLDQDFV